MIDWHDRFLKLAEHIAGWSKDPSTQVGAVIINDARVIISTGYNGLPPDIEDTDEILQNRELKYKHIIHGEINAMSFADRDITGFTLYVWPFQPCSICADTIIKRKIARVIAPSSNNPRWVEDFKVSTEKLERAKIELVLL